MVINKVLNNFVKEQMIKRDFKIKALNLNELVNMFIKLGLEIDIEEGYSPVEAIIKMREEED